MADFLRQIDWHQPWLAPLLPAARPILDAADWRTALDAAASSLKLCNHRGMPIHFVPQAALPRDMAYEAFISATGGVPTRENLHDFFNALVWLSFPKIKVRLNALQAAEIARSKDGVGTQHGHGGKRGKVRDGATIFDENAALFLTSDPGLITGLREHRWQQLFIMRRAAFYGECEVRLFGHALMEKLVTPYKAITAHAWVLLVDPAFFAKMPADRQAWIDAEVAAQLADGLTTNDFTPLPVLGMPGWWPQQNQQFYEDGAVFRLARRMQSQE